MRCDQGAVLTGLVRLGSPGQTQQGVTLCQNFSVIMGLFDYEDTHLPDLRASALV